MVGPAPTLRAAREREIKALEQIAKKCFVPHAPRFHERPYLRAVYKLYLDWCAVNKSNTRANQLAQIYGKQQRKDRHPIRAIIDCSAPGVPAQTRSKWSLALRFAKKKNVTPSGLIDLMEDPSSGGMAGCASGFARLKKREMQEAFKRAVQEQSAKKVQKRVAAKRNRKSAKKTAVKQRDKERGGMKAKDPTSW
jgi:hypothetical protein